MNFINDTTQQEELLGAQMESRQIWVCYPFTILVEVVDMNSSAWFSFRACWKPKIIFTAVVDGVPANNSILFKGSGFTQVSQPLEY